MTMPTTLTVDLFVSVDGFAGSDGLPGYFGYLGPDLQRWVEEAGAAPHVAIMGRRTYEVLASLPEEHRDEAWETMSRRETVVFSSSLARADWPGARIHHGDLVEEVGRLKADGDTPLRTVGSMSVARQLLAAGLVDRLRLMVFPLTAGAAGREPAFEGVDSHELELVGSQVLDANTLLVEYHPTGRDIPRA
jgi:dihydrofolate reductase